MADEAQPDTGQDQPASGGLFDSYLQSVPEDGRDTVAAYLKDASKNVEGRLETAAQLEKTLGPYKEVDGLSAYTPEQLKELLAWHQQVTSSDEAFQQWLSQTAEEAGLTAKEEQELQDAVDDGELTPEKVKQLVEEQAAQQVQPIQQEMAEWKELRNIDTEEHAITDEVGRLEKESGLSLTDDQKAVVFDLGMPSAFDEKGQELPVGDVTWVKAGFDRFREITAEGQRAFVNEKTNQPNAPLTAGGSAAFKPTTDFKEAREQLRERLRAQ